MDSLASISTETAVYTSEDYTQDFESDPLTDTEDGNDARKSTSLSYQYSDDFESVASRPPSSVRFSEDLEVISKSPIQRQYSSYSEDFESGSEDSTTEDNTPMTKDSETYTNYSTDTFEPTTGADRSFHYSESFESYTETERSSDEGSSEQTVDSVLLSPRKQRESRASFVTDTYDDESTYTGGYTTTETENTEIIGEAHKAKEDFIQRKLEMLRNTEYSVRKPTTVRPAPKREKVHLEPEEKSNLKEFLAKKCQVARRKVQNERESGRRMDREPDTRESYKERVTGLTEQTTVEGFGVTSRAVTHLRLKNTMARINKMANMPVHEPKKCKTCRDKNAKFKEEEFLKHKYAIASEKIMEDKLENERIRVHDPTLIMGEILKDLPRLSDDPREIYEQLMKPLRDARTDSGVKVTRNQRSEVKVTRNQRPGVNVDCLDKENLDKEEFSQFWEEYFSRLKDCPWFPQNNK